MTLTKLINETVHLHEGNIYPGVKYYLLGYRFPENIEFTLKCNILPQGKYHPPADERSRIRALMAFLNRLNLIRSIKRAKNRNGGEWRGGCHGVKPVRFFLYTIS